MKARTRTVVLLTAAIAAVSGATAEALPVGSPKSLRPARAADALSRAAEMDRWSVDFVNPRTRGHFNVTVVQRGQLERPSAYGEVFDSTWLRFPRDGIGPMLEPTTRDRLEWRGRDLVALTRIGKRWRVRVEDEDVSVDATLSRVRAGITAGRWRLPPWHDSRPGTLSWALPVATSRASGRMRLETHERDLRGWRASIEHAWGFQELREFNYDNWETAVVHTRGGGAWLLQGLNRADYLTGPGARDAFWLGVRAHVGPGGVRICRPRLTRYRWLDESGLAARDTRRAQCGASATTFRNPLSRRIGSDTEPGPAMYPATTDRGGAGWVRWIGHDLLFGGIPR